MDSIAFGAGAAGRAAGAPAARPGVSGAVWILQHQLLAAAHEFFARRDQSISDPVREAFLAMPRHLFVERYKTSASAEWHEIDDETLARHLPALYRDDGLGIFDDGHRVATISRPALVLFMVQMLKLEPGMRVFEVGSGSGWNAALMGSIVGPEGSVDSVEIVPALVDSARRSIGRAGPSNVRIHHADAGDGSPLLHAETFDRVVVTASAYDIPAGIRTRVRDGGLLLFVLRCPGGGDLLILFLRQSNVLRALESRPCEFVPMTGGGRREEHEPVSVADALKSIGLGDAPVSVRPFASGGRHADDFAERTFPLRSFLAATEPGYMPLRDIGRGGAFAVASRARDWLVIVRNGEALCYGRPSGWDDFRRLLHQWVDLGMPTMLSMDLCAYAAGQAPRAVDTRQWLMRRRETDFLWSA